VKRETPIAGIEHLRTQNVGREKIGRKLYARTLHLKCTCEGTREGGLSNAGHIFDEYVAAREQTEYEAIDGVGASRNDSGKRAAKEAEGFGGVHGSKRRSREYHHEHHHGNARRWGGVFPVDVRENSSTGSTFLVTVRIIVRAPGVADPKGFEPRSHRARLFIERITP
jgi:hypothetical protein